MPSEFLCIGGPLDGVRGTTATLETQSPGHQDVYRQYNNASGRRGRDRRRPGEPRYHKTTAVLIHESLFRIKETP